MTRKTITEIQTLGTWDKNIPMFMDDLQPQNKYDYFMALKHNLSNNKVLPVLFHRICGDYDSSTPVVFTEKFKLLKNWLFLTDRTDKLPAGAYLVMWKAWKTYQEAGFRQIQSSEDTYRCSLEDLFPVQYHMYISNRPMTQPLYYMYNKSSTMKIEDRASNETIDEYGIPAPVLGRHSYIQTWKVFEYINRHYSLMSCDYCGHKLTVETLCVSLECDHFVHNSCCEDYQCLQCQHQKLYPPWYLCSTSSPSSTAMELDYSENEDNTSNSV